MWSTSAGSSPVPVTITSKGATMGTNAPAAVQGTGRRTNQRYKKAAKRPYNHPANKKPPTQNNPSKPISPDQKKRIQKVTKPKKNHGVAKLKRQSEGTLKTAKILHPKQFKNNSNKTQVESKTKIRYDEPNITVEDLRSKAQAAALDSKGRLLDPLTSRNAPITILLNNYRRLSTDNPKYLDHFQAVYKIFKKQYDKEILQQLPKASS